MTPILASLSGLGTGLALIVAIGAQNAYLLRLAVGSGLRVVAAAVAICAVSDAVLIVTGTLGVGVVVERFPGALLVVRLVGAAFLVTYGVLAARRAIRPGIDTAMRIAGPAAARSGDGSVRATPVPPRTAAGTAAAGAPAGPGTSVARPGVTTDGRGSTSGTAVEPPGRVPTAPTTRAAVLTMLAFTWANPHVYLDTLVFLGSVANQQGADLRWWWVGGAIAASCAWFAAVGFGGRMLRPVFARPGAWRVFDVCIAVVMLGFGAKLLLGA